MFTALSRGIPSFGDLAWKAPVVAASDPSQTWSFPTPVLSPAGAAVPGQTMTAGANQAITSAPPFSGMTIVAGDRVLVTAASGLANSSGIWVVTTVGSGASKWVLTRATDCDTAAENVTGAMVQALAFLLSGTVYTSAALFARESSGTWAIIPGLLDILTVLFSIEIGDGSIQPAAAIHGGIELDGGDFIAGGIGPIRNVYTSSTTWSVPAGIHHIEVECIGGGGGGGAAENTSASQSSAGGGGGGGGYAKKLILAAALTQASYTVTRGGGGAGGTGAGGNGSAGGASSFSGTGLTTVQGNGGGAGNGSTATTGPQRNAGGSGGGASGGDLNVVGGDGQNGIIVRGDVGQGDVGEVGDGGSSFYGGVTRGPAASGAGTAGNQYGGGGAGGYNANSQASNRAGGAGANGVVIVTEYYAP